MSIDLFKFRESRPYLLAVLGDKNQRRGLKSAAAKFIGCHTTAISQILHGQIQLNVEQAEKLNRFLRHGQEESHYFLLIVQKERAGTKTLKDYFQNQIDRILEERHVMKKRLGSTGTVSKDDEQNYYRSWLPAAVHVALSVPGLGTADAIADRFRVPVEQISDTLSFLVKAGLAVHDRGAFAIGPKHVHLANDSLQISNHHRNWRLKAIQSLDSPTKDDLHYSSAVTISKHDAVILKDQLIENLKALNKVVIDSKEEEVFVMSFDFFKI